MPVGIVLKLNRKYEDLQTYLRIIKRYKYYNVPKKENDRSYKYLQEGKWLMIYDPDAEAITAIGKVKTQKPHPDNPEFPCYNYFDPDELYFPRGTLRLRFLERVFDNFHKSRRYRNISPDQFARLMERVR